MKLPLLLAAVVVSCLPGAFLPLQAKGPLVIDRPMRVSFESLGWTEDVLVAAHAEPARVRFMLPDGPVQGDPLWYGVRLSYEWTGIPGEPGHAGKVGDYAMLIGEWNGYGFYQLVITPLTDLDGGYKWSMSDMINGGSHGYETSPFFAAASTNFAMYDAVRGGWNEVAIWPYVLDAGNKEIEILVKKESEIVATTWRRAFFEAEARAEVDDEAIHVQLEAKNQGWGAPDLTIEAMVFREDGSRQVDSWDQGPLEPLASVDFEQTIANEGESLVVSVIMELDWGSGRQMFQAWPEEPEPPWYTWGVFRSSVGAMIALVVVWVGAPMLFRAWRDSRRSRP